MNRNSKGEVIKYTYKLIGDNRSVLLNNLYFYTLDELFADLHHQYVINYAWYIDKEVKLVIEEKTVAEIMGR